MIVKDLAQTVAKSVKEYVSKQLETLENSLVDIRKSLEPMGDIQSIIVTLDIDVKELKGRPVPVDGKDGESITVDDIRPLVVELVNEAAKTIPIPKDGKDGHDGKSVSIEELRPVIAEMIPQVKDGEDGRDGLDALDIQILPAINDLKSYPRGIYAAHNGGLWKTFKQTDGMDGWECLVDGIGDISVDYDGERGFSIKMVKSSGILVNKEFTVPMVLDRGVFRDTEAYKKFDGVTYGGSFWISQKENPDGKPGDANSSWRLSVKRGRDANTTAKVGKL